MTGTVVLPASWQPVMTGDDVVAAAERHALGTSARVVVWPPEHLGTACAATDDILVVLDRQASRFRADSELSRVNRAGGGLFLLGDGLAGAVGVALAAARWTGGLTDPTVGDALIGLGYDRDFAALDPRGGEPPAAPVPAPGWQRIWLGGPLLRLPPGIRLDLGATAKGVGADRAVRPSPPRPVPRAVCWSALAGTSPSAGPRPAAAGRLPWPRPPTVPIRPGRSWSGWPAERSPRHR